MDYCILLTSNLDNRNLSHINLLKSFLRNKGIPYDEIDGAKPENEKVRKALWEVAFDHNGKEEYPAVFIMRSNRNIQFIGNWDRIQHLLDADSISDDILKENPEIFTFHRFFRNMIL